ncbi:hypothetical protein BV97_00872 [Novosphingobium resinovorum]|uniref:Uncharacterized protein n=2 Tax=Sphingomonadales TaxID=204457 RepID=A0A031K392_9SPHN|nr:hypothetical protein BES08_08580 [Novosphingobium resinovorum]EZP83684.1 hypothetical protein BV97_00872 [Novosphingobium resinovorum]MBF7012153.1 hypothetical protein [Novosphingobium sp. HR1a]
MYRTSLLALSAIVSMAPAAALADTPRELLTTAAFQTATKPQALKLVAQAITASDRILAARPNDHEATLQRAIAIGYRGKLTRSRSDVRASLDVFQKLAAANPRDPEAQIVIAGWHLGAVDELGGFLARTALGARVSAGETALAKAVALGGDRAFYPGLAALLQIRNDPSDIAQARRWAEAAATGQAATPLDALMKRAALSVLPSLRANNGKAAAELARKLVPFGKIGD